VLVSIMILSDSNRISSGRCMYTLDILTSKVRCIVSFVYNIDLVCRVSDKTNGFLLHWFSFIVLLILHRKREQIQTNTSY
jgi:hypothetical protein